MSARRRRRRRRRRRVRVEECGEESTTRVHLVAFLWEGGEVRGERNGVSYGSVLLVGQPLASSRGGSQRRRGGNRHQQRTGNKPWSNHSLSWCSLKQIRRGHRDLSWERGNSRRKKRGARQSLFVASNFFPCFYDFRYKCFCFSHHPTTSRENDELKKKVSLLARASLSFLSSELRSIEAINRSIIRGGSWFTALHTLILINYKPPHTCSAGCRPGEGEAVAAVEKL